MDTKIDFKYLAKALVSRSKELLPGWLPGGKIVGREYSCSNIHGGDGQSFKVNTETGLWSDFATGEKGGDLISLYAAINNLSQLDAAKEVAKLVGHRLPDPRQNIKPAPPSPVMVKPPRGTLKPSFEHKQYGKPVVTYTYRDESNEPLFFISRYEPQGEKKQFIPTCYTAAGNWVYKMWPDPRPLYGLQYLNENKKPVLVVEGEKAAEAARQIVNDRYVVISWPGGTNAWQKADWSPIYNRNILIWPDADDPGRTCATNLAAYLVPHVREVKILTPPDGLFDGWDAFDALQEGYDWDKFKQWASGFVSKFELNQVVNNVLVVDGESQVVDRPLSSNLTTLYAQLGISTTGLNNPQPINNSDNVCRILSGIPDFKTMVWYDDFHKRILTNWGSDKIRDWSDTDTINLMMLFQGNYGFSRVAKTTVQDAVIAHAYKNKRNVVADWLKSLEWDGLDRISSFFSKYLNAEQDEYTSSASKNMWLSLVARVLMPGCKVDTMVILEGAQGMFKSTTLQIIGGDFYGISNTTPDNKDFYQALQGKMIVEIGELDAMNKAEITTIKNMLSTAIDRFRPPYGRTQEDFPRQCIFIGTTNDKEYLKDTTGARRFWPVAVGKCDIDGIKSVRDQLFAEAVYRVKNGENWYDMPEQATKDAQETRRFIDPWEQIISNYMIGRNEVSTADIATGALNIDIGRIDQAITKRIGKILRLIGYESKLVRKGTMVSRAWVKGYLVSSQEQLPIAPKHTYKNYAPQFDN